MSGPCVEGSMASTMNLMDGPVIWMCVHNEPSDSCEICDEEDIGLNGSWEIHEEQCQHEYLNEGGWCMDCGKWIR